MRRIATSETAGISQSQSSPACMAKATTAAIIPGARTG